VLQVFAIVLIPVAVGMFVRARWTDFAHRMDKPVRIASAVVLVLVIIGTIAAENENVGSYLADVGLITTLFCLASLAVGYWVPKMLGAGRRQSIACSMEIGVHNSTLAIAISISVLDSVDIAIPGAVYGVVMFPLAAAVGWLISRGTPAATTETAQERTERAAENS
ncbi:bile acid:sodium symporter family protein, partial [Streptomyces koyangensis]